MSSFVAAEATRHVSVSVVAEATGHVAADVAADVAMAIETYDFWILSRAWSRDFFT